MITSRTKGFTLIELMIVVSIIAILVVVAFPSYQSYVLKSHRTAAINALLYIAGQEANYYNANNVYATSIAGLGLGYTDPYTVPSASTTYYKVAVQAGSTSSAFTLQAVPQGAQTSDTCGTYAYTNLGVKMLYSGTSVTYSNTGAGNQGSVPGGTVTTSGTTLSTCWGN